MSNRNLKRLGVLFLAAAIVGHSQTRLGQCSPAPTAAARPDIDPATGARPAGDPASVAAKPDQPPAKLPLPVLPQIQPRPPGPAAASCWCGKVDAGSLTSSTSSQEVPMLSGLTGNFRPDHVLIQETKRFSSDVVDRLTVTARPRVGDDFISEFALKSESAPQSFAYEMPAPPTLTGTYDLILKFTGSAPLAIQRLSNFTAGTLTWEVCGYRVQ